MTQGIKIRRAPEWWNDRGTGKPDWNPGLIRWLAHKIHGCWGAVVSNVDDRGRVWVGFQCWTCGRVFDPICEPDCIRHEVDDG